jgi:hypothetical protein
VYGNEFLKFIQKVYMQWGDGGYRLLVGKPGGKSPLGRPRHRWKNDIKMEL